MDNLNNRQWSPMSREFFLQQREILHSHRIAISGAISETAIIEIDRFLSSASPGDVLISDDTLDECRVAQHLVCGHLTQGLGHVPLELLPLAVVYLAGSLYHNTEASNCVASLAIIAATCSTQHSFLSALAFLADIVHLDTSGTTMQRGDVAIGVIAILIRAASRIGADLQEELCEYEPSRFWVGSPITVYSFETAATLASIAQDGLQQTTTIFSVLSAIRDKYEGTDI